MTTVTATLREGLFASALQPSDRPSLGTARHAAFETLKARTRSGCAGDVADEDGHHPDTAVARMCWCSTILGAQS